MIPETATIVVDTADVPVEATTNGSTPTVVRVQNGRQKVGRAELSGDYEGIYLIVWTNPKRGLTRDFDEGDDEVRDAAVASMVLDHNLVADADERRPKNAPTDWQPGFRAGDLYPKPLTLGAIDDMPLDLYAMVANGVKEVLVAANTIPKA